MGKYQGRYRSLPEVARACGLQKHDDAPELAARTVPAKRRCSSVYAAPPMPNWDRSKRRSAGRCERSTPWNSHVLVTNDDMSCGRGTFVEEGRAAEQPDQALGQGSGVAEQPDQAAEVKLEPSGNADAGALKQEAAAEAQTGQQGSNDEEASADLAVIDLVASAAPEKQDARPVDPDAVPAAEIVSLLSDSEQEIEQAHILDKDMPANECQLGSPETKPSSLSSSALQQNGVHSDLAADSKHMQSSGKHAVLSPRDPRRRFFGMPAALDDSEKHNQEALREQVGFLTRVTEGMARDLEVYRSQLRDVSSKLPECS